MGSAGAISALREIQLQVQKSMQGVDSAISALNASNKDPTHRLKAPADTLCGSSRLCDTPSPASGAEQLGHFKSPRQADAEVKEAAERTWPAQVQAAPPSEPERFVAALTVEFTFRRLDYERVAMSCAVWVGLNQRVQEVVAERLDVPPGVVDVHLLPGGSHRDSGVLAKSVIRLDSDLETAQELRARAMRSGRELLRKANIRAAAVPGVRAAGAEATGPCGAADLGVGGLHVTVTREEIEPDLQLFEDESDSQDEGPADLVGVLAEGHSGLEIIGRPLSRPPSACSLQPASRPVSAYRGRPLSRPSSAFLDQSLARPTSAYLRQSVQPVFEEDPVYTSSVPRKDKAGEFGDASISQATSSTQSPGNASSLAHTGGAGSDGNISEDVDAENDPVADQGSSQVNNSKSRPKSGTKSQGSKVCLEESARIAERFGIALLEKRAHAIESEWADASNMNDVLRAANELLREELEAVMLEAGDDDSDWSDDIDEDCEGDSFWGSPVSTPRGHESLASMRA